MFRLVWFVCLLLCGCQSAEEKAPQSYLVVGDPWQKQAEKALMALNKGDLEQASTTVLLALNKFPEQPILHTLNGIVYEGMSQESHSDNFQMAELAYQTALHIDPHNWHTHYRMGRLKMRLNKYDEAQRAFACALKARPKDTRILYDLAFASYYAKDLPCAYASIKKALRHLAKTSPRRPLYLRAQALLCAAVGKKDEALEAWQALKQRGQKAEKSDLIFLKRRINEWSDVHKGLLHKASLKDDDADPEAGLPQGSNDGGYEDDDAGDGSSGGGAQAAAPPPQPAMSLRDSEGNVVIFDCILLSLSEEVSTGKGTNLLENFTDGIFLTLTPQSMKKTSTKGTDPSLERIFSSAITWGAINYNANILNVGDHRIELIGRPTLSTYLGTAASFNSGTKVTGGVSGGSGGSLVNIDIGTILSITPLAIEGDRVKMQIDAESSAPLEKLAEGSIAQQTIAILKTRVATTMQLKFNETAMIAGNYQRETTYDRSGVPLLEKVPLVQYFFSKETNKMAKQSILFLVTPRRKKDKENRFGQHMKGTEKYKKFPEIHQFLQKNHEFLSDISTEALIYQDIWPKLEHYHRGDVLQLPETPAQRQAHSLREFIYY